MLWFQGFHSLAGLGVGLVHRLSLCLQSLDRFLQHCNIAQYLLMVLLQLSVLQNQSLPLRLGTGL